MEIWSRANLRHGRNPIPPPSPPLAAAKKNQQQAHRSVKPIPMRVISISKKRSQGIRLLADEYMEKIHRYCVVEDVQVRSNPKNTAIVSAQIEGEDDMIMRHIKADDWDEEPTQPTHPPNRSELPEPTWIQVVMLDENGIDISSNQLADLIEAAGKGSSRMSFCIGGPYGHGPQLRKRANIVIRLSSMVLNHQIALIVLLEQLYRAWTILKGQNYHH